MKRALVCAWLVGGVLACTAGSSSLDGSGGESCSAGEACGASGTIQICTTRERSGGCGAVTYKASTGQSFRCATCNDCATAIVDVERACQAGSGSSSGGSGSGGPGSGGSSSGGSSSGGSSSGGFDAGHGTNGGDATTASCDPVPGSYTVHYTLKSGGTSCSSIADQNVTIGGWDGGTADAGNGCTMTLDASTCTYTTDCTSVSGSYSTVAHVVTTITPTKITGEEHSTTTNETSGEIVYDCTYDFTETKD